MKLAKHPQGGLALLLFFALPGFAGCVGRLKGRWEGKCLCPALLAGARSSARSIRPAPSRAWRHRDLGRREKEFLDLTIKVIKQNSIIYIYIYTQSTYLQAATFAVAQPRPVTRGVGGWGLVGVVAYVVHSA